jgi:hypothetical protein
VFDAKSRLKLSSMNQSFTLTLTTTGLQSYFLKTLGRIFLASDIFLFMPCPLQIVLY